MQITFEKGIFVGKVSFSSRQLFRTAGWQWNPEIKRWTTPDVSKVADFTEFCSGSARHAVEAYNQGGGAVVQASMATDSDIVIPAPPGLEYRPFQRAGIAYALAKANILLADPPGLGKTIQAIGIANVTGNSPEILIICPAYLKKNWEREFKKWDTNGLTVGLVETKMVDKLCDNDIPIREPSKEPGRLGKKIKKTINIWPDTDVVIGGIDLLKRHEESVKMHPWDILIVDECDDYTNAKTQRTKFIFGGGGSRGTTRQYPIRATKRLFLTGTPIQTSPINMWNFCRHFDPKGLGRDWLNFVMRYCDAYNEGFGINTKGSSNLEELNIKLREAFMVRRKKVEVLHELPSKTREIILLPNDGLTDKIAKELNVIAELLEQFEIDLGLRSPDKAVDALTYLFPKDIDSDMSFEDVSKLLTPDMAVGFEKLATFRKKLALAKAPMVKEHVDALLRSGEKVVLFCYHKEVAEFFKGYYHNHCAFITGKVPANKRQDEVDRFQDDPDCTILIANMAAGGKGFTMTAAHIAVFAEVDWLVSVMEQAEDRIWRIGQENACLILYMVVDGSLDAYMIDVLIKRMDMISRALDMQGNTK